MQAGFDLDCVLAELRGAATGWSVQHFDRVDSTMDIARQAAKDGCAEGTVILAEEQTAGRGRLGRSWVSLAGANLYFTVVLRPPLPVLRQLAMIAPLAVAEAIEQATGLYPAIKWPNDVQLDGLKCSGVLIDAEVLGDRPVFALAGIGINVNVDPAEMPELAGIATSIATALGHGTSREQLLAAVLSGLAGYCAGVAAGASVQAPWRSRLSTLGQRVRVTSVHGVEAGVVEDADAEGALLLRRDDGSTVRVAAGEVTLRT